MKVSSFHVHIHLENDEIDFMECSCGKANCEHAVAVLKDVDENNLVERERSFVDLVNGVDEVLLKEYVLEILSDNDDS